jgi:hypothetical protein
MFDKGRLRIWLASTTLINSNSVPEADKITWPGEAPNMVAIRMRIPSNHSEGSDLPFSHLAAESRTALYPRAEMADAVDDENHTSSNAIPRGVPYLLRRSGELQAIRSSPPLVNNVSTECWSSARTIAVSAWLFTTAASWLSR